MTILPRALILRQCLASGRISTARYVHVDNTVGNNMPFKYEGRPKAFAVKLAAFMLTGFSIPFIAAAYQRKKAST